MYTITIRSRVYFISHLEFAEFCEKFSCCCVQLSDINDTTFVIVSKDDHFIGFVDFPK